MIFIESKENNLLKETKKLKERKHRNRNNKYIIEGFRLIEEAFKADLPIEYLIITKEENEKMTTYIEKYLKDDIKIYLMSDSLFKELISTEQPQGILAVANMQNNYLKENGSFYLLCDKVQDPGNLGTIIRTAHAAGVDGIILTKGTVDIYNEKTIRSTMGSLFYIPVVYDDENLSLVKKLKEESFKILVTSLETDKDFYEEDLKGRILLTVGNEGNGVSDEIHEIADTKVKIPMPGNAESLNVAIATSVIIYEKIRQERCKN
ncbi:RNA methyltransferase [Clostridium neonatale]|uniref:TrmH family RNA methyltransferase n=1 Tax=Clostridium neonatale TaxID=137838 RepID=UPI00291BC8D3|nr:RNA methyltransferase [Clostridium neonatale]CAI3206167.1 putative tRNA/rRNA methyltransferase [Clostridium neonatale]